MNEKAAAELHSALAPSDSEALATMRVLDAVESRAGVTQRLLASELGIAVGLINAYIKRCVRKGYLKTTRAPARRYAYYLTPEGFAEKSRLAARFFVSGFQFFRTARGQCAEVFAECARRNLKRLVLCGSGDMCEVAIIAATEFDVELVGVYDPAAEGESFRGLRLSRDLGQFAPFDAAIVTEMRDPQSMHDSLVDRLAPGNLLAPPMLRIGRQRPKRPKS
ncbi:MAG: winged helix-turn-helix transcriptional regulator [Rhodospirillales bacterium]|nr:winged helix-turn-helix transcriptional regulator [Rhodospirillales bacterium]